MPVGTKLLTSGLLGNTNFAAFLIGLKHPGSQG